MKTQCPHCKVKFKARDESVGKKAKCPKCGQPFTIQLFVEASVEASTKSTENAKNGDEICSNCKAIIGSQEQAYIHNGNVVCEQCSNKLKLKNSKSTEQKSDVSSGELQEGQEKNHQTLSRKIGYGGVIVSVVIIIAVLLRIGNIELTPGYVNKNILDSSQATFSDWGVNYLNAEQELRSFIWLISFWPWFGAALILLVRSVRFGPGFLKGLLTFLGAYVVLYAIIILGFMLIKFGSPKGGFGGVIGYFLMLLFGAASLIYGLRPKKVRPQHNLKKKR